MKRRILKAIVGIVLIAIFSIGFFDWIRFQKLVNAYNKKVTIGMKKDDIVKIMGKPNHVIELNLGEKREIERITGKNYKTAFLFLYQAGWSARESILLYFNDNNIVVYKTREMRFVFIND